MTSCTTCKHLFKDGTACDAYPLGIPYPILMGDVPHNVHKLGDRGILWAPLTVTTEKHLSGQHNQQSHAGGGGGRPKADIEADLAAAKKAVSDKMKASKKSGDYSGMSVLRRKVRTLEDELKGAPSEGAVVKRAIYDAAMDGNIEGVLELEGRQLEAEGARKEELREKKDSIEEGRSSATSDSARSSFLRSEEEYAAQDEKVRNGVGAERLGNIESVATKFGYSDSKELEEALLRDMKSFVEGTDVYIRAPIEAFEKILKGGFQNQHATGTSQASRDAEGRERAERNMFNIPKGAGPEAYPIYGYFTNRDDAPYRGSEYGDAAIRLKPSIKSRTTISFEDSLMYGEMNELVPSLATNVRLSSIVPGHLTRLASRKGERPSVNEMLSKPRTYWEAQVHGKTTWRDIESVVFETRPSPSLAARLDELGIPYEVGWWN